MRGRTVRILCLVTALLMLFSATACQLDKEKEDSAGTTEAVDNTATKEADDTTAGEKVVENFNETGYPIVNSPITLKFLVPKMAVAAPLEDMKVLNDYKEKTNINVEWIAVLQENYDERKNLTFASNDLPDAIFDLKPADEMNYGGQGMLIPLNYLIEKYAPNIKNMFKEEPLIKKVITTPDGNIYSLPQYQYQIHIRVTRKFYINKTWLDALKLDVPTTTEEYYNVLKAFKTQDPNGNSKADEIPLLSWNDYADFNHFIVLAGPWGIAEKVMVTNGKVSLSYMQDGYKEAMKYFATLYKEKLLDNECFTQNQQQAKAKGNAEEMIVGSFVRMAEFQIVGNDRVKDMMALTPLIGPNGDQLYKVRDMPVNKGKFAITNVNKYPEATIRWVDYAYSPEGALEFRDGPEGINWKWNDKGEQELIEPSEGMTFAEFRHKNTLGAVAPYYRSKNTKIFIDEMNQRLNDQAEKMIPYAPEENYPALYHTEEQQKQITPLQSAIDPYVEEMRAKFITGDVSINEEWDNYISTLKKMGSDELLKIFQDAYDVYSSNN